MPFPYNSLDVSDVSNAILAAAWLLQCGTECLQHNMLSRRRNPFYQVSVPLQESTQGFDMEVGVMMLGGGGDVDVDVDIDGSVKCSCAGDLGAIVGCYILMVILSFIREWLEARSRISD